MKRLVGRVVTISMVIIMVAGTVFATSVVANETTSIRYAPNIAVQEQKPVVVYSGTQNTMVYTLTNETPYSARNLSVIPDVSMVEAEGFRLMNTSFILSDTTLSTKEPVMIQLEAVVDDSVAEGVYPIKLLLTYDNESRDHYSREIMTYFEVRDDLAHKEKLFIADDNAAKIRPTKGQTTTFVYKVKNEEDYTAGNVKTYIQGLPANYFALASTDQQISLGNIGRYVTNDVAIDYRVSKDVPDGSYPYEIVLIYENEFGNKVMQTSKYNLLVSGPGSGEGEVSISEVSYPKTANQDVPFTTGFKVVNSGEDVIEDLVISMGANEVFIPKSASVVKVDNLEAGGFYDFSAEIVATGEGLTDRNYPLEFTMVYNNGSEQVTERQIMGVYIIGKEDGDTTSGNAPKIIVSDYRSEPQIVKAGGEFDLQLDFMNTNKTKTIYNVKAYITAKESTEDTGNVFTPVGSSNTFYIDEIGPKGASSQSIKLFTVPDAAPKTYTITINFEYEDKDGVTFTATEYVGIPVTQVTKVEASDFNMPTEVMAGEGINVYFDIFNTGKAKVYNLLIKADGNFTSDPVSRYIGNFEAGSSDYFDAYVNFQEPGSVEGMFVISYEDAVGEPYVIEKKFTVNVMEAYMPEFNGEGEFMPEDYPMPVEGISRLPLIIGGLIAFVILAVMIVIVMKKRKKKNRELNFDEDD